MRRVRVRPPQSSALKLLLPAALAVLALALVPSSFGVVNLDDGTTDQISDFDARAEAAPGADQLAAASGINAKIQWTKFGTPAQVFHRGGYVAVGVKAPNAAAAARSWLATHKTAFGLNSVRHLRLMTANALRGAPNFHAVSFRQAFGNQLSADGVVTVAVLKAKRSWRVLYASSSLTPDAPLTGKQKLSPLSAWLHAARAAGIHVKAGNASVLGKTADGALAISALGVSGAETVKPIAFGTPRHGALRAYDATVTRSLQGAQNAYRVIVDAATGRLLYRQSQVFNATDNPTWKGFAGAPPYNPINAYPWNYPSTDSRETFCWTATAGCTVVVGDNPATNTYAGGVASKQPWDAQATVTGFTGIADTTWGNNVDDARVWSNAADPHGATQYGSPTLVRATSATRDYQPAWTNAWYTSGCNPNNVNPAVNPLGNDIEASTASMFVGHNRMHDFSYYLGFDEGHWNAQQYNNGVVANDPTPIPGAPTIAAPLGNDGLLGNAQSGAATGSRDNANMNTGADGVHPTTNQFVWQPLAGSFYAPCVDGAYDFSVYGHEFGHLIENRMIGKGVGARQGNAAGAMGEAFGDFDALEVTNALHVTVPGSDHYTEGAYATGNGYNGIRDFLAGRPMGGEFPEPGNNPDTDPLNYGNFGFDIAGVEVHADGEIWVAVQMDLRDLYLARYPSSGTAEDLLCAHGQKAATACPGDRRWIQDYYDAQVIMPRGTTMIQARDAVLAADLARFGGSNQDVIWQGYAMRGFGNTSNTVSNADGNPVPAFDAPASSGITNATLNFSADSKEGSSVPVNAQIFVGDYSAGSTQIADTNPATIATGTNATGNLDNTAPFVPNGSGSLAVGPRWNYYNFTAVAPGYGIVRFKVKNLHAGETRNITIHFPTNYASATQGATLTTDAPATGTNVTPNNIIDDNEGTTTTQSCTPTATCLVPVNGRWSVIKLGNAGTGVSIRRLGVSAMFSSRFVGLRSFDAYSCRAGKSNANPNCDGNIAAGWTKIITGQADSFPGVNPRPGTQDESFRYFSASPQPTATHLKFVPTANQCTGQPSFQGDQDLDPANNSECRTGIRRSEVHAAEVEVFATKTSVDGTLTTAG